MQVAVVATATCESVQQVRRQGRRRYYMPFMGPENLLQGLEMLASITIFSTILLAKERRRYDEIS